MKDDLRIIVRLDSDLAESLCISLGAREERKLGLVNEVGTSGVFTLPVAGCGIFRLDEALCLIIKLWESSAGTKVAACLKIKLEKENVEY